MDVDNDAVASDVESALTPVDEEKEESSSDSGASDDGHQDLSERLIDDTSIVPDDTAEDLIIELDVEDVPCKLLSSVSTAANFH
jgi:hypothetical protein